MRLTPLWLAILAISFAARSIRANPRIHSPKDPAVSDILTVAIEFTSSIAKGDGEHARALFAGSGDDTKVLEAELRFVASSDA